MQRALCALVIPLDEAGRSTAPATELGRQFAQVLADVRRDLGC
jgi:hypothetical protein